VDTAEGRLDAEAALADLLQQLVRADPRSGDLGKSFQGGRRQPRDRAIEETAILVVDAEQRLQARLQLSVAAAGLLEVRAPGFGGSRSVGPR
jgi:hypothetical protein